ncbi:MAG: TolC family protein [Deltaproteobacteria bacterium]|nr:TolC family protein [Deltaproteobacteria bacterium]
MLSPRRILTLLLPVVAIVLLGSSAAHGQSSESARPEVVVADGQAGTSGVGACTLVEALATAVARHPLMQAARENTAVFEARLKAANLSWIPTAGLKSYVSATPGKWGDALKGGTDYEDWGPYLRVELSGYIPVYTFGKLSKLREMAGAGVDVGKAQEQIARAQVERLVAQAWYALELTSRLGPILEEGERYLARARTYLEKLRDEDSEEYDDVDMLRLKVYESEVAAQRLDLERTRELALTGLQLLTGLDSERFLPPGKLTPVPADLGELATWLDQAFGSRGELLALDGLLRVQTARVSLEKRRFLPDLFVGAFYTWAKAWTVEQQGSPFAYDPYNSWYAGAGLGLKLDLDLAGRLGGLDEERANLRRFAAQREAMRQLVTLEVEKSWREARDLKTKLELHRTAYKAARGWVIAKVDLYEAGLAPLRDLTDALSEFFKRRLAFEQGVMEYNLALATLVHACGGRLEDILPAKVE